MFYASRTPLRLAFLAARLPRRCFPLSQHFVAAGNVFTRFRYRRTSFAWAYSSNLSGNLRVD